MAFPVGHWQRYTENMTNIKPNLPWYLSVSKKMGVSPRCPFATVEACPRFYQSLSLLGRTGSTTEIDSLEDKRLLEKWEKNDLWPKTREQETSISGNGKFFDKFCPEVSFDRFGYFASFLGKYSDEIDHDLAHDQLGKICADSEDYRWVWSAVTSMHFTECPLYSVLLYRQNDIGNNIGKKSQASPEAIPDDVIINNVPPKTHWISRWRSLSSKLKIVVISITTIVAILATFLTNIETINNFFKSQNSSPLIPNIVVKLSNSSEKGVIVFSRGDFMLWLPGPGAKHQVGKYEFIHSDGKSITSGSLIVPPKDTVTVLAKILNEKYFSKILSQSDCDLSLLINRNNMGLTSTNQIPFTREAIAKYVIETDVGK